MENIGLVIWGAFLIGPFVILGIAVLALGFILFYFFTKKWGWLGLGIFMLTMLPVAIYATYEWKYRPNKFNELCTSKSGYVLLSTVPVDRFGVYVQEFDNIWYKYTGMQFFEIIENIIDNNYREIEVIDDDTEEFGSVFNKYNFNLILPSPKGKGSFSFQIEPRTQSGCSWHDNMLIKSARLRSRWKDAGHSKNECISVKYKGGIDSRYLVRSIAEHIPGLDAEKFRIVVTDRLQSNKIISERSAYRLLADNYYRAVFMELSGVSDYCPRGSTNNDSFSMFFKSKN